MASGRYLVKLLRSGAAAAFLGEFVSLRPRPDGLLDAGATAASMRGDHGPMVTVLLDMLSATLRGSP